MFVGEKTPKRITPTGFYADFLRDGASCRYSIEFPDDAEDDDKLTVNVKLLRNMRAWVVEAEGLGATEFREQMLYKKEDSFTVEKPNKIFLTLIADQA